METAPAIDAAALRAARERAGLSQNELARVMGMASGVRISLWERGEARPRNPALLHALADAVGVPAVTLLQTPTSAPGLRWLRFAAGLSVEDLARAIHASTFAVRRWESRGLDRPPEDVVVAVAAALGITRESARVALQS